jgi:type I pantothenate kinase
MKKVTYKQIALATNGSLMDDNWQLLAKDIIKQLLIQQKSQKKLLLQISGSVAVGKTTFAAKLQQMLTFLQPNWRVQCLSTDSFLYENKKIDEICGLKYKGFPISYDVKLLNSFIKAYLQQEELPALPYYSHEKYDVDYSKLTTMKSPDVLILEGVIALNESCLSANGLGVFLATEARFLQDWYFARFLNLCEQAKNNKKGYFTKFANFELKQLKAIAIDVWQNTNWQNWQQHIAKTKDNAYYIINKNQDHSWQSVLIREEL